MREHFIPAVVPPEGRTEKAYYFAFRDDQLLVELDDEKAFVPQLLSFSELELTPTVEHYLGTSARHGHCFAVQLPKDTQAPEGMAFHGLRQLYGPLDEELLWIGGRGIQIVDWHRDHQYCGRCGMPTETHPTERATSCPDCRRMFFPRLSPAIIVLIHKGDEFLLARNHRFRAGMYSIIAGFVEPGETLEETVAREIREEVGIEVKNIRYFGSQPWPFPNSLMFGFTARYAGGELKLAADEIADAGWYSRDPEQLPRLPDGLSISRKLIDWFLEKGK